MTNATNAQHSVDYTNAPDVDLTEAAVLAAAREAPAYPTSATKRTGKRASRCS